LFVFQGEGQIKDFPGNYSEFREWEKQQKTMEKSKSSDRSAKPKDIPTENKNKATFKQKKEFEQIQLDIASLEEEKQKWITKINEGTEDHEALIKWSRRIQEIDEQLKGLEQRWLELSEYEGIDE